VCVAQRLHHHALGYARYRLERLRWERMFTEASQASAPPPV
jgi:hypothetical protein